MVACAGWISLGLLGLWAISAFSLWRHAKNIWLLKDYPKASFDSWPSLTVIIPVKNEAEDLEKSINSLLEVHYPNISFLVVDDRSTDATPEILTRLQTKDRRLTSLRINHLPEGWLGKPHALYEGVKATSSELILFTDGDVLFGTHCLERAVSALIKLKADMIAVMPELKNAGVLERIAKSTFQFAFFFGRRAWKINAPDSKEFCGAGSFSLVRRKSFEEIGGAFALRLQVIEDVSTGELMRMAGKKLYMFDGFDEVSVRYHSSAWNLIKGLEKNGFAACDYSVLNCSWKIISFLFVIWAPWIAALVAPSFLTLSLLLLIQTLAAYHYRLLIRYAHPFEATYLMIGTPILCFALLRSMVLAKLRGGIVWRDTFYPLDLLRAHVKLKLGGAPIGEPQVAYSTKASGKIRAA